MHGQTAPEQTAYATLILRLALGIMFLSHGLLKILVFTIPGTVGFFESVGYPGWMAYLAIAAEIGGGTLLILGVYTRWVALALLPLLLGAAKVHLGNGWVFSNQGGGWEYPVFLVISAIVLALLGDGACALQLPWRTRPARPQSPS
jgi:putative oxidoreductase